MLRLDSLPVAVTANDGLTRFILNRNYYAPTAARVKPPALLPLFNPQKARFETSVFRTDRLRPDQIWLLGYEHVETATRRIRARADGLAHHATSRGLQLDVNGRPYPRHVDIIGWPGTKDEQLLIAIELVNDLSLEMDPRPPR